MRKHYLLIYQESGWSIRWRSFNTFPVRRNILLTEKMKKDNAFFLGTKSDESEFRTMDARKELFDKDFGAEKKPNEYILPKTAADLDEGVHERSYEIGNKMVIERTVKRVNKVDTYRKETCLKEF